MDEQNVKTGQEGLDIARLVYGGIVRQAEAYERRLHQLLRPPSLMLRC